MRFERKGSGAVLWVGDVAVKASVAGRDCSMSALEKRLGEFVAAREPAPTRTLAPEPLQPAARDWKTYVVQRQHHYAERTQQREQLREQHRDQSKDMLERHREERRSTFAYDWRGRGADLNGFRSLLAARQAQEKAELRERQQMERERLREQLPRWSPFDEWLHQLGGPALADEWRFRERPTATIVGDREDPARPRDIRAFMAEIRGWEVHYGRIDDPRGGPSFIDRGREIRIHDLRRESVLAALQLSAQKWGTFEVIGSDDYKRTCVELAAQHGFRITNPELQKEIAEERARRAMPHQTREAPTPQRSPVRDVSEAYCRHLGDLNATPRYRDDDPSRIDAAVAVRLRATGHDRGSIERAIREEAAKARPHEQRDWGEYAKRTADRAFGLPGRRELDAIARTRDRLFALEGRGRERDQALDLPRPRGPALGR
jgi:hypothetical protein